MSINRNNETLNEILSMINNLPSANGAGGGIEYTNIIYNDDNTITLTDKDSVDHTMVCEYTDGVLSALTYDGKSIELTYEEDNLVGIGAAEVDMANVPCESGGAEITPGFTSEKYKKWLEINGYTIVNFTLTSQATADFIINHPLGRPANSIVCFRADLDSEPNTKRIAFAVSLDGSTADTITNRLVVYNNTYMTFAFGIRTLGLDYRAILENTTEHIKLRYVTGGTQGLIWASGDYYLAVL